MRIAYIAHWDVSCESGVLKKIARHIRAWRQYGHEVKLFALSPSGMIWQDIVDLPIHVVVCKRLRNCLFKAWLLFQEVKAWKADLVYFRFHSYYPGMGTLMASIPTVLEINSNDLTEMKATAPKYRYWYHRCTREWALTKSAGMAFLTRETATEFAQYGKPFVVIGDSIDLSEFPELPAPQNPAPRLVFVSSHPAPWHGLDKVLWLADHLRDWQFDLIGVASGDLGAEQRPNVSAHGFLGRAQYDHIMIQADVAIGTLALHRIGMNEAAPLKLREYLAYGLPTIIGYHDTDFPEKVPYLLELPNTPNNVMDHMDEIVQFVRDWLGKRVSHKEIAHLDVHVKERRRLAFFQDFLK